MFWNKKKPKSKPQIKTTVPKTFKAKEPPPKWQPTFGETKKKDEKTLEVITKSEPKIDWEDKFLKSFQKLTYRHRAWDVWRDYILLHACSISNVLDKENYGQREKRHLKITHQYSQEEQAIFPELAAYTTMTLDRKRTRLSHYWKGWSVLSDERWIWSWTSDERKRRSLLCCNWFQRLSLDGIRDGQRTWQGRRH